MTEILPSDRSKDRYGLNRDLTQIGRRLNLIETARTSVVDFAQGSVPNHDSWGSAYVLALSVSKPVPPGYRYVQFSLFVSAGMQLTAGSGIVRVFPVVRSLDAAGVTTGVVEGPRVAQGGSSPLPVSAFSAISSSLKGLMPGDTVAFEVWLAHQLYPDATVGAGTANAFLTANLTYPAPSLGR